MFRVVSCRCVLTARTQEPSTHGEDGEDEGQATVYRDVDTGNSLESTHGIMGRLVRPSYVPTSPQSHKNPRLEQN